MSPLVLTLAGLWNSGPQHWQTHWEARHPQWSRVPHGEWQTPDKDEWVAELDRAIGRRNTLRRRQPTCKAATWRPRLKCWPAWRASWTSWCMPGTCWPP